MLQRKRRLRNSLGILLIFTILFVAGCRETALYHNLTEQEANEILVVLYQSGIEASKEKEIIQNEVSWNVMVGSKDLAKSRAILLERNLPRKRELGLGGVYKEKGLIPTPDEQKARFLLAIKGEIVNSLEKIPEVVDADVVINIPTPEEFSGDEDKRPTASVVLKLRPEAGVTSQVTESKVQKFIANTVEDLNPRDVSVIISYLSPPSGVKPDGKLILPETIKKETGPADVKDKSIVSIAGVSVSKSSASRMKIYLFVFFAILIIMSAILIVNVIRTTRMKQEFKALTEGVERPLIEGEVEESGPEQLESGGENEGERPQGE